MIAISGKTGTGKTTIALELLHRLGGDWRVASFADELRRECTELFGIPPEVMRSQEGKLTTIDLDPGRLFLLGLDSLTHGELSVRQILQLRGQHCRYINPNYWTQKFHQSHGDDDRVIIDDVRYLNELDYARSRNAFTVRLLPYPGWKEGTWSGHESETALDNVDGWDVVYRPQYGALQGVAEHILSEYRG